MKQIFERKGEKVEWHPHKDRPGGELKFPEGVARQVVIKSKISGEPVRKLRYEEGGRVILTLPQMPKEKPVVLSSEEPIYEEPWTMDDSSYIFKGPKGHPLAGRNLKLATGGDIVEMSGKVSERELEAPQALQDLPEPSTSEEEHYTSEDIKD
jgi:hypothetical protein